MSEISKNIRKIIKAWGGKTTGSGIGDAVMDLYNSLPFYSETKEIVRSITLNASGPASATGTDATIANLVNNNPESVTVYHKDRPCKYLGIRDDSSSYQTTFSYGIDDVVIVRLSLAKSNGELRGDITARFSEGDYVNFVDVEVPDAVEVVKKLDPKFVGGDLVVDFATTDGQTFTVDKTLDELLEITKGGVKLVARIPNGENSFALMPMCLVACDGVKQIHFSSLQVTGNKAITGSTLVYHESQGVFMEMSTISPAT